MKTTLSVPAVAAMLLALVACSSAETPVAATVTVTAPAQPTALSISETCDQINGYLATLGMNNPADQNLKGYTVGEIQVVANGLSDVASRSSAPFVGAINTYAATMTALAPYYGDHHESPTAMLSYEDSLSYVKAGDTLRDACWTGN